MATLVAIAVPRITLSPLMAETVPAPGEGTGRGSAAPKLLEAETQLLAPKLAGNSPTDPDRDRDSDLQPSMEEAS